MPDIVASPPIYVPPSARSDYVQPPTAQTTAPAAAFVDNPQAQSTDMPSTPDDHTDRDEYDADDLIGYWAIKVQHSGLFGYGEGCVQNVSVVADKIEWLVGKLVTSLRNEPEQEKTFKDAARDAVITLVEKFGNAALAVKLCDPALAQQTMQRHPEWTPR